MSTLVRDRTHLLVLLLPVAVAALVAISAAAPAAHAAAGCLVAGPKRDTPHEGGAVSTRICHAYRTGAVVDMRRGGRAGVLDAGDSWFVCQRKFRGIDNPPVAGARNDWWLFTLADRGRSASTGGWGWFPANLISGGNDFEPIPGLRVCSTRGL
jgi:hypothetical protein